MFQSLGLFVFNFLLLAAEPTTEKILPPQNLSLRWITAFIPELSWEPPQHSMTNCTYRVGLAGRDKEEAELYEHLTTHKYSVHKVMEGGFLNSFVNTQCNGIESEAAVFNVDYPELVEDLECYSYTAKDARCSWSRKNDTRDLRFFYQLVNEDEDDNISELLECSSFNADGAQTSCDLQATTSHTIYISLNGTWNNTSAMNTFKKETISNVKPPPLTWNVIKRGDKLDISWVAPEVLAPSFWEYIITYTECDKVKNLIVKELSHQLILVPRCRYCISIVAKSYAGSTTPSNETCVEADAVGSDLMYIAVVIPLVFACMAVFTLMLYKKHKKSIFPKVPQPRDLISDIFDNNNENTHFNLYCPAEEEVCCKVTLVADTQTIKPDC